MKRLTAMFITAIMLLFILTTATSGERIVSGGKVADQAPRAPDNDVKPAGGLTYETEAITDITPAAMESTAGTDDYGIPWQSINAGGGNLQSDNYQMMSSVGQSVIGHATSTNYEAGIGYWYGTETGEDCFCGGPPPAFGDITCDAAVNPIDVVKMVNFVYKNIDDRCSDGWVCPYDPGDVNCDDAVNPVDVVRYVNYVYKNITPFPCDPCGP